MTYLMIKPSFYPCVAAKAKPLGLDCQMYTSDRNTLRVSLEYFTFP